MDVRLVGSVEWAYLYDIYTRDSLCPTISVNRTEQLQTDSATRRQLKERKCVENSVLNMSPYLQIPANANTICSA